MELRASAHGGRLNPAYTIPGATREAYLTHQMSPSPRPQAPGIVASTATVLTASPHRIPLTKATRGHRAIFPNLNRALPPPAKRLLEKAPPLIPPLEVDLRPSYRAQ